MKRDTHNWRNSASEYTYHIHDQRHKDSENPAYCDENESEIKILPGCELFAIPDQYLEGILDWLHTYRRGC